MTFARASLRVDASKQLLKTVDLPERSCTDRRSLSAALDGRSDGLIREWAFGCSVELEGNLPTAHVLADVGRQNGHGYSVSTYVYYFCGDELTMDRILPL